MILKISLLEFILRTIPESFLIILAVHLLSYKKVQAKGYINASIFLAISIYLVRMLPINYGIHTIINTVICVLAIISINKIDVIKAISSVLKITIIISICEWINVVILDKVMKLDAQVIFNEPLKRVVYSMPSMMMFGIVIVLFYKYKFRTRMEMSNVCH